MLHLSSTEENQVITRNIFSNVIFIDEQETFYINCINFQRKCSKGGS